MKINAEKTKLMTNNTSGINTEIKVNRQKLETVTVSVPVPMKKLFPVKNGHSRALVAGRSLFRRPLSGTVFLPTSDTVAPSHNSKLPLRPSSSLLPSPSYLDSLEDLRFFSPHRLSRDVVLCG